MAIKLIHTKNLQWVDIFSPNEKDLTNLVQNVQQYDTRRNQHLSQGPGFLLISILEILLKRSAPLMDRLNHEIGIADKSVFDLGVETLEHLAKVKKAIITYRRINKMHKYVLEKLARSKKTYLKFPDSDLAMHNLVEYAENIWNMLSTDKESLESLEETNQSLAAHKMNDILRILTVFSVIIFLLTLLINILLFLGDVSHIGSWPYIVPATSVTIALVTLGMLLFFQRKGWL